jgi:hypothetical protein
MLVPSDEPARRPPPDGTSSIRFHLSLFTRALKRASDQDARPVFRRSHRLPRKGYQQDALFAVNKDELSPVNEVHRERGISLTTAHFTRALQ